MSTTTATKWGNGCGVLIPKVIREKASIEIGDKLDVAVVDGAIVLTPLETPWTLSSLMKDGAPQPPEFIDPGASVGRELW